MKFRKIIHDNISIVRFCVVGGIATLVDYIIYSLLFGVFGAIFSKMFSMCCSMTFSFIINRIWSFNAKSKNIATQLGKYMISQLINISINVSVNYMVLGFTNSKIFAFIAATGVAMCANYIMQKFWVFRSSKEEGNE